MALVRVWAAAALLLGACAAPEPGTLTIVGGGLSDDNADVWGAFLDSARPRGDILIIPAASGYPAESGASAEAAMVANGMDANRIRVLPLAVMDDPTTGDVDESLWRANATDPELAARIENAAAIWMTGGDQRRITELLLGTPALDALRKAYQGGAGVGGTSAGAAAMSDPMITGGVRDGEESEPLTFGMGLGLLPRAIVDQHFTERGRLWRLQAMNARFPDHVGVGIDEDTALVMRGPDGMVMGRGAVHTVGASGAQRFERGSALRIDPGHYIKGQQR